MGSDRRVGGAGMLTVATLQLCAAMSLAAPSTPSAALRHRPVLLAMQQGTKPDVHKQDAQEQKISVVDAVAMVGGSAVGGGFLAVPEVTATLGILPSTAGLLMSWAFLVMAGLAYVEAAGACCRDADGEGRKPSCSILALSRRSFGRRLPRLPTALSSALPCSVSARRSRYSSLAMCSQRAPAAV